MKRTTITGLFLFVLTIVISGFAGYGVLTFQDDLAALEDAGAEDISWTSNQLELELSKLTAVLLQFQIEGSHVDADVVNDRFDILWSRIALFQEGEVGARLASYDRSQHIVSGLFELMKQVDRQVVTLQDDDNATAANLFQSFIQFQPQLSQFSRGVTLGEEQQNRQLRENMMFRTNRTLLLSGLATFFALLILAFIFLQSRKFELLAHVNQKLAVAAEKASSAKSKFLTMMSHELRTPMNGVMGLLSLAQQNAVQPSQKRLLEQAEVSAQSMLSLLTDIFDFSALQADDVLLEAEPFEIKHLKLALEDKFSVVANREGLMFDVCIDGEVPKYVGGDFRRIRQAIGHLAQYVVETAGTQEIRIALCYMDGVLTSKLSFAYSRDGGDWSPDLILGDSHRQGDKFATAALGPMIARGLIDTMGGSIKMDSDGGDRIVVLACIPCEIVEINSLGLRIYTSSDAMRTICRATLANEDVVFFDDDPEVEVRLVIIESGGENEQSFVVGARSLYPSSILIALGTPLNPEDFDFKIKMPLDFMELRNVIASNTKFN